MTHKHIKSLTHHLPMDMSLVRGKLASIPFVSDYKIALNLTKFIEKIVTFLTQNKIIMKIYSIIDLKKLIWYYKYYYLHILMYNAVDFFPTFNHSSYKKLYNYYLFYYDLICYQMFFKHDKNIFIFAQEF